MHENYENHPRNILDGGCLLMSRYSQLRTVLDIYTKWNILLCADVRCAAAHSRVNAISASNENLEILHDICLANCSSVWTPPPSSSCGLNPLQDLAYTRAYSLTRKWKYDAVFFACDKSLWYGLLFLFFRWEWFIM